MFDKNAHPLIASSIFPVPQTIDNSQRDYFKLRLTLIEGPMLAKGLFRRSLLDRKSLRLAGAAPVQPVTLLASQPRQFCPKFSKSFMPKSASYLDRVLHSYAMMAGCSLVTQNPNRTGYWWKRPKLSKARLRPLYGGSPIDCDGVGGWPPSFWLPQGPQLSGVRPRRRRWLGDQRRISGQDGELPPIWGSRDSSVVRCRSSRALSAPSACIRKWIGERVPSRHYGKHRRWRPWANSVAELPTTSIIY